MTRTCCAPSTRNKGDLALQDPQESRLRDVAKMTTFNANFGENSTADMSDTPLIPSNAHVSDLNHRDILLISGYIHELHNTSTFWSTNNVVFDVKPITDLCIHYFYIQSRTLRFMYLMAEQCASSFPSLDDSDDDEEDSEYTSNDGGIYISEMHHPEHKYYANIYDLDDGDTPSMHSSDWIVKFAGLCSTKDLVLPSSIHKKVLEEYKRKHGVFQKHLMREYNLLFRVCGSGKAGWSDTCNAVIVDETYLNQNLLTNALFGFNWRLPQLPIKTGGNAVTFSDKHGLISVGGYKSNQCHVLPFDSDAYFEQNYDWIWNEVSPMHEIRWFPSCCMMEDKLIAMAGSSADHEPLSTMECFDFDRNEWQYLSSCNNARKYGGLCNIDGDKLYIGGGDYATQSVEWYDVHSDRWFNLPNTQIPHKYYPNLWKHKHDPSLLYISCSYSNSVECIDLRTHETSWNVICAAKLFQTDSLDLDYNQFRSIL
eukprot:369074_1